VSVTGYRLSGGPVSDTDTAYVSVIHPELMITKDPDLQTVQAGSPVTFTIQIENTGDVDLTGVYTTDPFAPACDRVIGNMPVGSSTNYTCVLDEVHVGFTNVISVSGTPPAGPVISNNDTAQVDVTLDGLIISKTPNFQISLYDSSANFTLTITNSTSIGLVDVQVLDPLVPDCDRLIGDLGVDEAYSYTCALDNATEDIENIATVYASSPHGLTLAISDTASLDVIVPEIEIARTPNSQYILSGGTVTFEIEVTNSGDTMLSEVSVTDAQAPDCNRSIGEMEAAEVFSYSCSLANVTSDLVLIASATGKSLAGSDVLSSVTTYVDVISPDIEIEKLPDLQNVPLGQTATFTIEITNSGDAHLEDVTILDGLSPDCDRSLGALDAGEQVTYTCIIEGVESDFTNQATVSGIPPAGPNVSDLDEGQVHVLDPGIQIAKKVDPELTAPALPITYTIQVTNTGELAILSLVLTDTLPAGLSYLAGWADPAEPNIVAGSTLVWTDIGPIQVGESVEISFRVEVEPMLDGVITNHADARGMTDGGIVMAQDTAGVRVQAPSLAVDKRLTGADVGYLSSNMVTFTIAITNTGISAISYVPLEDNYDADVLAVLSATPSPVNLVNDGNLEWADLTGPAPGGLSIDLEPDAAFEVVVVFNVTRRISVTTNSAIVAGASDEFGNTLAEIADSETLVDVPTAVDILYFRSYRENDRIVLEWETAWEWNNWGFHIYRGETYRLGDAEEIAFVLGQGWGQLGGSVYRYIDTDVVSGETYTYWLEDEDLQGSRWITGGPLMVSVYTSRLYLPVVLR
ncbi:MAG: DUF11 domain-containing protein, partial [Anaerolineales bacterium]|nr:DUF11 domain-containing protein [Anaerolineales bacterium]